MRKHVLNARDHAILDTICNNARLSYNQIAKITHISKDSVRDRIAKLEKELFILSYFPLINYPKIGLELFHVYIRLSSLEPNKNLLNELALNSEIVSITWIMGKYDLELQIIAKTRKEAIRKLRKIIDFKKIKEIDVLKSEELKLYSMGLKNNKFAEIKSDKTFVKIDSLDFKLINLLAKDGRAKIIDLAEKLKLEEYQVRYRIKQLLKQKVILGFYTRTNKHRCGFSSYIMLLKLKKDIDKEKLDKLHSIENLYYLKKCSGKYQYVIRFHAIDNRELIKTLTRIRGSLEEINDFEVFPLLERHKFLPF